MSNVTARKVLGILASKRDNMPLRVKIGEARARHLSGEWMQPTPLGIPDGDICLKTVSTSDTFAEAGAVWDELDDALDRVGKERRKTASLWYYHGGLNYRVTGVYENRGTVMIKAERN